jgi:hypothetical protein
VGRGRLVLAQARPEDVCAREVVPVTTAVGEDRGGGLVADLDAGGLRLRRSDGRELSGQERVRLRAATRVLGGSDVVGRLRRCGDRVRLAVALVESELLEDRVDRVERVVLGDVHHRTRPCALEREELILGERKLVHQPVPLDHDRSRA